MVFLNKKFEDSTDSSHPFMHGEPTNNGLKLSNNGNKVVTLPYRVFPGEEVAIKIHGRKVVGSLVVKSENDDVLETLPLGSDNNYYYN